MVPVVALLALAGPVRAQQGTVDFTPFAGVYLPTADLFDTFQGQPVTPEKQKAAFVFGAGLRAGSPTRSGWRADSATR